MKNMEQLKFQLMHDINNGYKAMRDFDGDDKMIDAYYYEVLALEYVLSMMDSNYFPQHYHFKANPLGFESKNKK